MKLFLRIGLILVLLTSLTFAGTNLMVNGDLEHVAPNFWMSVNDNMGGATTPWDLENGHNSTRSLKVVKPAKTPELVGWMSANNADLYWNNAAADRLYNLSFWAKTDGVNTNPANDDAKIGALFVFKAGGVLLGEQFIEVDQSTAAADWKEYTAGLLIPAGTEPDEMYMVLKMGKDATGTVWFDDVGCGSDPWSMWPFNGDFETPMGWMMWAAGPGAGFANTVKGPAHSGEWSALLVERDAADDEMVFYSEPAPAQSGKWYKVSVWAKTDSVNTDPAFWASNTTTDRDNDRLGLCFFFHKGYKTSWDLTPPGDMYLYFEQRSEAKDWTEYSVLVKAPDEEVEGLSVRARFTSFTQGYCWYDDFSVEEVVLGENVLVNGDLEHVAPNFWMSVNDNMGGSLTPWDLENGHNSMRSLKVVKPATTSEHVGWISANNADLYWNNAAADRLYNLSFWAKTQGVNTNPATDDAKIGASFVFKAGGTLLGEQFVEVDQSMAATDWKEYTAGLLIPAGTDPDEMVMVLKMGKNATGTVWFDDVGCGSDPWSMWPFNGDFETPTGWMMWAAGPGAGFANTVKGPAHSGEWSALLVERDAADDEMVFYSEPAPAEPNKWYMISFWAKTDSANANPKFLPSNVVYERDNDRMGLCFFFHKGYMDSWDLTPPGDMFGYVDQRDSTKDWTQYIYAVKAPAEEVAGISVRARFNSFPQGYCWYDDFAVRPFDIKITAVEGEILSLGPRMPESHAVVKNYPNPFNPETTIEYYLPKDGVVELAVYNMLGQKVRTVVNDFRLAGTYKINWNGLDQQGRSVPSGIYFVQLLGQDFQVDHKILLIK